MKTLIEFINESSKELNVEWLKENAPKLLKEIAVINLFKDTFYDLKNEHLNWRYIIDNFEHAAVSLEAHYKRIPKKIQKFGDEDCRLLKSDLINSIKKYIFDDSKETDDKINRLVFNNVKDFNDDDFWRKSWWATNFYNYILSKLFKPDLNKAIKLAQSDLEKYNKELLDNAYISK